MKAESAFNKLTFKDNLLDSQKKMQDMPAEDIHYYYYKN